MLFSLAAASKVYGRLEFSIVNASNMGRVAAYDADASSVTNCENTEVLEDEQVLFIRSGFSKALKVPTTHFDYWEGIPPKNVTSVYYRNMGAEGNHLLYYKSTGAQCYYWIREAAESWQITVDYEPPLATENYAHINLQASDQNPSSVLLIIYEHPVNPREFGRVQDFFGFQVEGTSNDGNLRISPAGQNRNGVLYSEQWQDGRGLFEIRNRTFTSARGSIFRSITPSTAIFSMYAYNQ